MQHVLHVIGEVGEIAFALLRGDELFHDEVVLFVVLPFAFQIAQLRKRLVVLQLLLRCLVFMTEALGHLLEVLSPLRQIRLLLRQLKGRMCWRFYRYYVRQL